MLNEKQIYNRMKQCYEAEYGEYDGEAEWYGSDNPKEWLFYIPSQRINVKLLMNEEEKRIDIYERIENGLRDYRRVGNYSWGKGKRG